MPKGIRCELITWEAFYALARKLALIVHEASFHPDMIVAIGRGGYMPARILSDFLDIFELTEIKIEHYHGVHKRRIASVRYPLIADITGKKVLLIDDVSDSGDTFDIAIDHLREHGEFAELRTGVLHHKTTSSYRPDFFADEVREWRWIIYPWAAMEDLRTLLHEAQPVPETAEEFADYLLKEHGIEVEKQTMEDVLHIKVN